MHVSVDPAICTVELKIYKYHISSNFRKDLVFFHGHFCITKYSIRRNYIKHCLLKETLEIAKND